ncbi:[NiFe]-hydrogenase III apoprotein, small subunit [Dehalogenimonas alkenigignens]|uniref:[NiFe]-hydrogenase III apoprotein, small subunit n=1 Tax=Dehalogenimonas alkenigignens TaxID=1217799 RepID=A0A0W0GHI7_9CHLR|nr:NADH-quinone oxidoreductase subunit NuoB [Dehalogenimonas alkenigignens]KTB48014.1 [NiFe]-hydrogenase III apoprotein, small subunit [Dehalogenimonas alkenigignens]
MSLSQIIGNILGPKRAAALVFNESEFEKIGLELKGEIDRVFGRSLAIRELDTGSDNAVEIELNNLGTPYYDVERFGVCFVASPRHADVIIVTGAVTLNMAEAARKTYEAMPQPGWVIAVGDDACGTGLVRDSYAVLGAADKILPVDFKIPGNPPTPTDIIRGLLAFMTTILSQKKKR